MEEKINIRMRLKNGIWQDSIPNFGPSFSESIFLESTSVTWTDIWDKVKSSENVMNCINSYLLGKENDIVNPISLKSLNTFLDKLDKWVADNDENLTFPPTKDGWRKAVYSTIENEDVDTFTILCGAFPEQIKSVVNIEDIPQNKIKKWWGSFNETNQIEVKDKVEIKSSSIPLPSDKKNIEDNTPDKKVFTKKPEGPYPPNQDVKNNIEELNVLIEDINRSYEGSGTTLIDDYCKRNFLNKNSKDATEWFTKVFFSSFQHMDEEKINFFIDNIPAWRERPVETRPLRNIDVNNVLDDIAFWSSLKYMQKKVSYSKNQEILKSFVPSLLDISTLSVENKINIGKNMLKWAKGSEDAFRNKLMMWTSMGGSITEQKNEVKNGVFDSKKGDNTESLIKWIAENKNPKWDTVVIEYAKEKDLNLYSWYPNDFKSEDLFELYQSSNPVSRPTY